MIWIFVRVHWNGLLFLAILLAVISAPFQIWGLVSIAGEVREAIGEGRAAKARDFLYVNDYRSIRRRARRRRIRRALAIVPKLLVFILAGAWGTLEVGDDYKGLPPSITIVLILLGAAGILVLAGYDCRRRIADLFGDLYLVEGRVLQIDADKKVQSDEPKVPSMLIQSVSEFFCPTMTIDIDESYQLTKHGTQRDTKRFTGIQAIDLVSGSSTGMTLDYVAVICTRGGRCLGRESQFAK